MVITKISRRVIRSRIALAPRQSFSNFSFFIFVPVAELSQFFSSRILVFFFHAHYFLFFFIFFASRAQISVFFFSHTSRFSSTRLVPRVHSLSSPFLLFWAPRTVSACFLLIPLTSAFCHMAPAFRAVLPPDSSFLSLAVEFRMFLPSDFVSSPSASTSPRNSVLEHQICDPRAHFLSLCALEPPVLVPHAQ